MAERGSNDKSNKTLRAYLVYDYIFKKSESDYFSVSSINAYLQTYGINCDNRAIVRDIEAINQAIVMLENELEDVEAANEALEKEANQFIRCDDLGRYYRTMKFLDWFVDEQMDEEDNADSMVNRYKLFGSDPKGLYALDQEYAARVYNAPSLVL